MAIRRQPPTTPRITRPALYDAELDNVPRRPPDPYLLVEQAEVPERYQRLVANPFLAIFGGVAWVSLLRWISLTRRGDLLFPALCSGLLLVLYLQYHCLDCGGTGHLLRWRRHDCLRVRLRRELNRPRRFRGPTPGVQTFLWVVLMGMALLVAMIRQ